MNRESLFDLLNQFREGELNIEETAENLLSLPKSIQRATDNSNRL